ncbi:MAG: HAMP domain-containing sensor histidine kinase [Myxococcota bacterium]
MRADLDTHEAELVRGLTLIGRELGIDIMSVLGRDSSALVNRAEWRAAAGGVEPPLEVDLNLASWLRGQLSGSAEVVVDNLDELPKEAHYAIRLFMMRNTTAMAALPLPGAMHTHGYLVMEFIDRPHTWEREELAIGHALAELIGSAMERQVQQQAMLARQKAARAGERSQNQLLTMFAHELRAPLTAIIGYAEMISELSSGPDAKRQKQYVKDLLDSAHHMSTFISDTLSLARIDGGEVSMMLTRFDVVELVQGAIRQVVPRSKSLAIGLETELPDGAHYVYGDRSKLTQLITNLLDNAIKFTTHKGKVRLALTVRDDDYDVEITDTGIDLDEPDQKRIFRRFEQMDLHTASGRPGPGLGLALVKRLADLHEGEVFVDSAPDHRGSSFRVTLRRRPNPPAPGSAKVRSFFG